MHSITRFISPLIDTLRRRLAPTDSVPESKRQVVALTDTVLLISIGLWWVGLLLLTLFGVGEIKNTLIGIGGSILLLGVRELLRRGHTVLAIVLGFGLTWAAFTSYLYNLGTPFSVHLLGYMAIVIFVTWTGGARFGIAAGLLNAATVYVLARAANAGLLPQHAEMPPLALGVNLAVYLGVCTLLFALTRNSFLRALRLADDEVITRRKAEADLLELNATLEARVAARTAELSASEERYRTLLALSPDGVFVTDNAAYLLACNEQGARMHGYRHSHEMIGRPVADFYAPGSLADLLQEAMTVFRAGQDVARDIEALVRRRDGSMMEVECSIARVPWENAPAAEAFVTSFRDIARRKQLAAELDRHRLHLEELVQERTRDLETEIAERAAVQAALRRSEANLAAAQRIARLGSWEVDLVTGEQRWSAEIYRIFHVSPADPPSTRASMWQAVHPEDVNRVQAALARLYGTGERFDAVYRLTFPDGEVSVVHGEAEAILDETGRPVHVHGIVQDITEQERVKEALQSSQAMLAEAERIAHIGSWRIDLATGAVVLSDELRRVFGFGPENGFGPEMHSFTLRDIDRIIHPDDLPAVQAARMHALESAPAYGIQYRIVLAGGEIRVLDVRGEIRRDAAGQPTHVYGMAQDITERARGEAAVAEHVKQLTTLHELSDPVSYGLSLDEIINTYLERLIRFPGFDMAHLYLLQGGALRCLGARSRMPLTVEPEPLLAVGECLVGLAVEHGRLEYAPEIKADPRADLSSCGAPGILSMAALPLSNGEATLGALAIGSTTQDAFADQLGFLETIAGLFAGRLQNALLYQETRERAAGLEEIVLERTRELQTERDRTQAILETVGESVVVADLEGRVLYVNPATLQLSGASRDEVLGQPLWHNWSTQMYAQVWPPAQTALAARRSWQGDVIGLRRDGTTYVAALTATPLYDESGERAQSGSVWVQRDITAIREAERLKDRFVSNVSHELRTPISVIGLSCDNLVNFTDRLTDGERRQMFQDIHEQAHVLSSLIEDILTLSQIDGGRAQRPWQELDLTRLVEEQVERQRPLAEGRSQNLTFTTCPSVSVQGNAGQVQQIVRNLLDNAIKYTPPGGQVHCICETHFGAPVDAVHKTPGAPDFSPRSWAVIRIVDNGIGIAPVDFPLVFERFYRVQGEGEIPGTGLGLPIARELATLHGGWITIASAPGEGSTFTVYLPLHEEQDTRQDTIQESTS